jgi:hypothetical protein
MARQSLEEHFGKLSDEQLHIERKSGRLVAEAQEVADEEYSKRLAEPIESAEGAMVATKEKRKIAWWEWLLIIMIVRAVFKFFQS